MSDEVQSLHCPSCEGDQFEIKYEAAYIYSYAIDADAPGLKNIKEFLPFQYDTREQVKAEQYVQCRACGAKYDCFVNDWDGEMTLSALQEAINASHRPYRMN